VKFSLLECICLQTSKLLKFAVEQNGNRTFYHLGCCLLPTALPAQQLPRAGAKAVQIRGQKWGHTPGYGCGHPLTAVDRCQDKKKKMITVFLGNYIMTTNLSKAALSWAIINQAPAGDVCSRFKGSDLQLRIYLLFQHGTEINCNRVALPVCIIDSPVTR